MVWGRASNTFISLFTLNRSGRCRNLSGFGKAFGDTVGALQACHDALLQYLVADIGEQLHFFGGQAQLIPFVFGDKLIEIRI